MARTRPIRTTARGIIAAGALSACLLAAPSARAQDPPATADAADAEILDPATDAPAETAPADDATTPEPAPLTLAERAAQADTPAELLRFLVRQLPAQGLPHRLDAFRAPQLPDGNAADRIRDWADTLAELDAAPDAPRVTPYRGDAAWAALSVDQRRAAAQAILARREARAAALGSRLDDAWYDWFAAQPDDFSQDRDRLCRVAVDLADAAYLEAHYGRRAHAYDAVLSLLELAAGLRHEAGLPAQLTRVQIGSLAADALQHVIAVQDLDMETASRLATALADERARSAMAPAYDGEIAIIASLAPAAVGDDPDRVTLARDILVAYAIADRRDALADAAPDDHTLWARCLIQRLSTMIRRRQLLTGVEPAPLLAAIADHPAAQDLPVCLAPAALRADPDTPAPLVEQHYDRRLAIAEAAVLLRLYALRTRDLPSSSDQIRAKLAIPWPTLRQGSDTRPLAYTRHGDQDQGDPVYAIIGGDHGRRLDLRLAPADPTLPATSAEPPAEITELLAAFAPPAPTANGENPAAPYARGIAMLAAFYAAHPDTKPAMPADPAADWPALPADTRIQVAQTLLRADDAKAIGNIFLRATNSPAAQADWTALSPSPVMPVVPDFAGAAMADQLHTASRFLLSRAHVAANYDPSPVAWLSLANVLHLLDAAATQTDPATTVARLEIAADLARQTRAQLQVVDPDARSAGILLNLLHQAADSPVIHPHIGRDAPQLFAQARARQDRAPAAALALIHGPTLADIQASSIDALHAFLDPADYWSIDPLIRQLSALSGDSPQAPTPDADSQPPNPLLLLPPVERPSPFDLTERYQALVDQQRLTTGELQLTRFYLAIRVQQLKTKTTPYAHDQLDMTIVGDIPRDPWTGQLIPIAQEMTAYRLSIAGPDATLGTDDDIAIQDSAGKRQPAEIIVIRQQRKNGELPATPRSPAPPPTREPAAPNTFVP